MNAILEAEFVDEGEELNALLDGVLDKIRELRRQKESATWVLGRLLSEIHTSQAWKARGRYASFAAFARLK